MREKERGKKKDVEEKEKKRGSVEEELKRTRRGRKVKICLNKK